MKSSLVSFQTGKEKKKQLIFAGIWIPHHHSITCDRVMQKNKKNICDCDCLSEQMLVQKELHTVFKRQIDVCHCEVGHC